MTSELIKLNQMQHKYVIKVANGGIWQKAKIPPNKHASAAYGTTIAGFPSQTACGGGIEKCHIIGF